MSAFARSRAAAPAESGIFQGRREDRKTRGRFECVHAGNRFVVISCVRDTECHGSYGGDRHQEILVKRLSIGYALGSLSQDIVSDYQIGDQVADEQDVLLDGSIDRQEIECRTYCEKCRQDGCYDDPFQHPLLLLPELDHV